MVEELTTYIPYAPKSRLFNLGAEYNRMMEASPSEWVCFLDHDAMFLRRDWHSRIINAINETPDLGLLSVQATRIARPHQKWPRTESVHNIAILRKMANKLTAPAVETTDEISGVVIVTSKTVWQDCGGFDNGFLGVDWAYSARVRGKGHKVMLLRDNPVYHWWRADEDMTHIRQATKLHKNPYHKPLR